MAPPVPEAGDVHSVGYLAAFGGGIVSFASPCTLPMVPAYLSVVTGLDLSALGDGQERRRNVARVSRDTALFIGGFTVVFVLLGPTASAVGRATVQDHVLLTRALGGVVIVMGLYLAGSLVLRLPALYGEARFQVAPSRLGPLAAPVAGAAFGFGWTPCIGPVLGSVLTVAASRDSVTQGAFLLLAYALGLAVPFLATGLALGRLAGALGWVRRHFRALTLGSATLIVGFGVLLTVNRLSWVTIELEAAMRHVGLGRLVNLG
jgi:cytochrome c-type biogenesis protein